MSSIAWKFNDSNVNRNILFSDSEDLGYFNCFRYLFDSIYVFFFC